MPVCTDTSPCRWYCYNVLKGDLVANRPVINEIPESDSIAFQYDNTSNTKPFTDTWTETWKNTESATLSVKNAGEPADSITSRYPASRR